MLFGEDTAKYSEALDILKLDKNNVGGYDLRQFLKKWKSKEYDNADDKNEYLSKFGKQHGFSQALTRFRD